MFTEKIYRTSVSSVPAGALTNPPTAYQIKPPLEAQTHSLSHTHRHTFVKTIHYQCWGSGSHVQRHCRDSWALPHFLQPNCSAGRAGQWFLYLCSLAVKKKIATISMVHPSWNAPIWITLGGSNGPVPCFGQRQIKAMSIWFICNGIGWSHNLGNNEG